MDVIKNLMMSGIGQSKYRNLTLFALIDQSLQKSS